MIHYQLLIVSAANSASVSYTHLDVYKRQAYNKMRWSKQFNTVKQKVNQIAMENAVVIVEVVGNIHADDDLLEKVLCQQQ